MINGVRHDFYGLFNKGGSVKKGYAGIVRIQDFENLISEYFDI